MFKTITDLLAKRPTLHAEMELDHVELSSDKFILGLRLTWVNGTPEPMEVREVGLNLYDLGKKESPQHLIYHGRFVRIPYQKTVTKIAGANSFCISPRSNRIECLRLLTRAISELKEGTYAAELLTTITEGTYLHDFELKVVPGITHRISASENEASSATAPTSSAFTRALRIGQP